MQLSEERQVITILDQALSNSVGVEIELLDADARKIWKQRLSEVRKKMPQFGELIIIEPPAEHLLWIVKEPEDWTDA